MISEVLQTPEAVESVHSYSPSSPILIQSDDDFVSQSWPGNGTPENPYEISGLSIIADDIDCIKISDTTVFFRISDCFVSRVTWPDDPIIFSGIKFFNVTNGEIGDIEATHKLEGIFIEKSINCTIKNSQLYDNVWYGCELRNSTLCTVTNCTFSENNAAGLVARVLTTLPPIRDCTIVSNTFIDNDGDGISLAYCNNFLVADNILLGNYRRTIGKGDGIASNECVNCSVKNNFIHESDLGIGWSGINCTLENNTISASRYDGLVISNSNECDIINNSIYNCKEEGIRLSYATKINLSNNVISDNNMEGIEFRDTVNCSVVNNTIFSNSEHGVAMLESSFGNILRSNIFCNNSLIGIMFDGTSFNNTAFDNIFLWNGLSNALDNGTDNSWDDNVSLGNGWDDYNEIGPYPILGSAGSFDQFPRLADTSMPKITSPSDFQYDEGTGGHSISWNVSGAIPNLYQIFREHFEIISDDWNNDIIDVNVDSLSLGIYNYTLVITDLLGNKASDTVFVSVIDGTYPTLDSPEDIEFTEGTTGHVLSWNPEDFHPESYLIEVNNVETSTGAWNSSAEIISINLDSYTAGSYNVTLFVTDVGGNSISDSVNVTVISPVSTTTTSTTITTTTTSSAATTSSSTPETTSTTTTSVGTIDTTLVLLLSGGAIGMLAIVVIILKRK